MSRRSQARRLPRALDMTPPASPRRRLHRNHTSLRPGSVAQSNLVRACSPSLSARLTAEKELRILMSEVQLYHGDYCGRSKH
uniref:Uncharacterized protein n=1 Tax=Triticum urartu TaxID=4572 RepID=A0A8R7PZW9_TRIUA